MSVEYPQITQVFTSPSGNGMVVRGAIYRQRQLGSVTRIERVEEATAGGGSNSEFYPASTRVDGSDLKIVLVPGYVRYDNPYAAGNKWLITMPTYSGTALDAVTPPEFTVSAGDSIYAKVRRTGQGVVDPPVTMVVSSGEISDHYQPEDSEQPSESSEFVYVEILEVYDDAGTLRTKQKHSGPILFLVTLVGAENVGGFKEVHKKFNRTTGFNEYRTLAEDWGVVHIQADSTITTKFDAINVGSAPGEILILEVGNDPGPDEDKAQFRTIAQGPSGRREITIDLDDKTVRVYGNGYDGSVTLTDESAVVHTLVESVDGLVKTLAGSFGVFEADVCDNTDPDSPVVVTKQFVTWEGI